MSSLLLFFKQDIYVHIKNMSEGLQLEICNDPLAGFDAADGVLVYSKSFYLKLGRQLILAQVFLYPELTNVFTTDITSVCGFFDDHAVVISFSPDRTAGKIHIDSSTESYYYYVKDD